MKPHPDNCFVMLKPDVDNPIVLSVVGVIAEICLPHIMPAWPIFERDRVSWIKAKPILATALEFISLPFALARTSFRPPTPVFVFNGREPKFRHFMVRAGGTGRSHLGYSSRQNFPFFSLGSMSYTSRQEEKELHRVYFSVIGDTKRDSGDTIAEMAGRIRELTDRELLNDNPLCSVRTVWADWNLTEDDLFEVTYDQASRISEEVQQQILAFAKHRQHALASLRWDE